MKTRKEKAYLNSQRDVRLGYTMEATRNKLVLHKRSGNEPRGSVQTKDYGSGVGGGRLVEGGWERFLFGKLTDERCLKIYSILGDPGEVFVSRSKSELGKETWPEHRAGLPLHIGRPGTQSINQTNGPILFALGQSSLLRRGSMIGRRGS